jgi:hypothetical protein
MELVVEDDLSMSGAAGAFPILTRSRSSSLAIAKVFAEKYRGGLYMICIFNILF